MGNPVQAAVSPGVKSPARAAAWETLRAWEEGRGPVEALRDRFFARRRLSPQDRSLALEMTQGVLRHMLLLDLHIDGLLDRPGKALPPPVRAALRLGIYQILFLGKIPARAAVHETVELLKGTSFDGLVPLANALLRRALVREPPPVPDFARDPSAHLVLTTSTPSWLVDRLIALLGAEEAREALFALNRPAPLALRVNTLAATREDLLAELAQEGVPARAGAFSPDAVILGTGTSPAALAAFQEGRCTVQDEGAQLLAPLLGARPGETVLDACAAPGGKAGHLAQLMGDKGLVLAADLSPARVRMMHEAIRRLRIICVRPLVADMTAAGSLLPRGVDRVLLDAPCTGTGILRRHPEGKWRKDPRGIGELTARQEKLLLSTSALLPRGGRLLYTTCSLLPEENEEVVERFLARGDGFTRVDLAREDACLPSGLITPAGDLRTWPHRQDCDGFYAALLVRQ